MLSGSKIPAVVFDGGIIFSINTRFRQGIRRFAIFYICVLCVDLLRKLQINAKKKEEIGFITSRGFNICSDYQTTQLIVSILE